MFSYKTVLCPFNLTKHEKDECVYAHHLQDYRRNPAYFNYEPIVKFNLFQACFHWKTDNLVVDYNSDGCPNGVACNMCHGWKELSYHPSSYRVEKCKKPNCKKGECQNYHNENEKRVVPHDVFSKIFKIVPKNRVVEGIFKSNDRKVGFKPMVGLQNNSS